MEHTRDEVDQASLVCKGRGTTNGFDAGTDADALAIQIDIATTRTEALDALSERAFGLVADEQDVMPGDRQALPSDSRQFARCCTCHHLR